LGKISNALGKYTQERQAARLPKLTRADRIALISYNPKTGHLLNPDTATGKPSNHSMEALKKGGTLQRLLNHKLIFPGGKLTPKGLVAAERLKEQIKVNKPAKDADRKIKQKIIEDPDIDSDDVIIELKEEAELVELSGEVEASPKKVIPLLKRPAPAKSGTTPQPEFEATSTISRPSVEEIIIEHDNQETTADENKDGFAVPDFPHKLDDKKVEEDHSQVPVPAASFDDNMLDENLVSFLTPKSYEAEQFKMIRNAILFPVEGVAPQSILVTSAWQGEGKSFVSANLAVSIAMNINKHVLLIDCDLRKPDLHRLFGFGDVPGLSDYLAEGRSLDSLLLKTAVEKLTLLPGGPKTPNPSELASSERMSAMLQEVKQRYQDRLIVIDSPPPRPGRRNQFFGATG